MNLFLVKPGIEKSFIAECTLHEITVSHEAPGILSTRHPIPESKPFCFPFWILRNAVPLHISSDIRQIDLVANWFCEHLRTMQVTANWHLFWLTANENGFTSATTKQDRLKETLKKRISRISKLADSSYPEPDTLAKGLFIAEDSATGTVYIATEAFFCGQRRMKDDPEAPSRSYLKIEEAFTIFGQSPQPGATVADLGAAPGGWTWAALKRGATVFAIDNGPLKKGPLGHPNVRHCLCDAFSWKPENVPVDWLFCDMVQKPPLVIDRIRTWVTEGWCRYAIVNFKYGYSEPAAILNVLQHDRGIRSSAATMLIRHLFHDRDEFTLMLKTSK